MKKIIFVIIMLLSALSIACESNIYAVYYLPIEAEFYTPPTLGSIMQYGTRIELDSCVLTNLFENISNQEGIEPQSVDYKGLRVIIVNNKNGMELFVTADKNILSADKRYDVDMKFVDDVLKEIVDHINKNLEK